MDCNIFIIEFYNKEGKTAPRDAHSREEEICRKRPRSARECAKAHSFLLYRKFLKSSEMVYNEQEIKNDITKERRWASPMTLYMEFFVLVYGKLHYLTIEKESL